MQNSIRNWAASWHLRSYLEYLKCRPSAFIFFSQLSFRADGIRQKSYLLLRRYQGPHILRVHCMIFNLLRQMRPISRLMMKSSSLKEVFRIGIAGLWAESGGGGFWRRWFGTQRLRGAIDGDNIKWRGVRNAGNVIDAMEILFRTAVCKIVYSPTARCHTCARNVGKDSKKSIF